MPGDPPMQAFRPLFVATLSGLALSASPALAEQTSAQPALPPLTANGTYEGSWSGTFTDLNGDEAQADFTGHFVGDTRFVSNGGVVLDEDGEGSWREVGDRNEAPDDAGPPPGPRWGGRPDMRPALPPQPNGPMGHMGPGMRAHMGYSPEQREDWLKECRHRLGDNGVGGAVIGGVIGGVAGNRIAGKGHRVVGTIAGAAVGAAAGAAIDKGEDAGRVRDECEAYLDRYEAYYSRGYAGGYYGGYGGAWQYGAGYARQAGPGCGSCSYPAAPMPMMWVPVMIQAQNCCCKPKVRKIVTVEYVPQKPEKIVTYEKVPTKVIRTKYVKTKIIKQRPVKQIKQIKQIKSTK